MIEISAYLNGEAIFTQELAPGEYRLGRSPENELVLDHQEVRPRHARLDVDYRGLVTIEDRGSNNGVMVDGAQVRSAVWRPGQMVVIKPYELRLRLLAPASQTPAPQHRKFRPIVPAQDPRPSGKKHFVIFLIAGMAIAGAMAFMAYLDGEEKAAKPRPAASSVVAK